MKKILIPTDFSSCAVNALNFAIQTAKLCPVEINLLHVVDRTDSLYIERVDVAQEKHAVILEEIQNKLDLIKASIAETESVEIRTFLREGDVDETILELSEEKGIDMIMMGTFGINGLKDRIWGSKTAGLTGKTTVPVMIIPYEYDWKVPHKILLATSFFEDDPSVLQPIVDLATGFKSTLYAVIFTDKDLADVSVLMEQGMNMLDYEKKLKKYFNSESVITCHLSGDKFEDTMQEYIKTNDIDILAMITYQRSLWDRVFKPSATRRMSYHTEVPLLIIPAAKKDLE
ncbi:MAG: universal stress protein [Chitinophagaceae bacterium]|nr:universal stress protein [Chitinophagaceae bacterium]